MNSQEAIDYLRECGYKGLDDAAPKEYMYGMQCETCKKITKLGYTFGSGEPSGTQLWVCPSCLISFATMVRDRATQAALKKMHEEEIAPYKHIPCVDPYTVEAGERVVYNYNNRWTLVRKIKLSCDKCGHFEWNWIVRHRGQIQIWDCDDTYFWEKVVLLKHWPKKKTIMDQK